MDPGGHRLTSRRMDLAPLQVKPGDVVDGARTVPEPESLARPFNVGTLLLLGDFIVCVPPTHLSSP